MVDSDTQEIIIQLKAVKEERHLSIPEIKKLVDATGTIVAETTIRRVFRQGSEENDSFNYANTLRPIAQALLVTNEPDADTKAFLAINDYKDRQIEDLEREKDKMRNQFEQRCMEYEKRMEFLRNQIELKDVRMDRKDIIIEKLLDQVLICGKCPNSSNKEA